MARLISGLDEKPSRGLNNPTQIRGGSPEASLGCELAYLYCIKFNVKSSHDSIKLEGATINTK